MSTVNTWMPLYIGDYLGDTGRLTTLGHGAYLLILMDYWRNGPPPDDDELLAGMARVERKIWDRNLREVVRSFFHLGADGLLHQTRVDLERAKATDLSEKRRIAGQKRGSHHTKVDDTVNGTSHEQTTDQTGSNSSARSGQTETDSITTRASRPSALPSPSQSKKGSDLRRSDAGASQKPDARNVLWSEGLETLRDFTGFPLSKARSVMGKFCKAAGDDCGVVSRALAQAVDLRPGDFVAWMTAACADATPTPNGWIDAL